MTSAVPKIVEEDAYDVQMMTVAQESFTKTGERRFHRQGHLLSFAYGESAPEEEYVGGGEHWVSLSKDKDVYKFPQGHRFLLSNKSGDIASAILEDTKSTLHGHSWHMISLTPGGDFAGQDALLVNGFQNAAEARGESVDIVTVADGNTDFTKNGLDFIGSNYFQPNHVTESNHNIYTTSLGSIHEPKILGIKRRSVVIWSGGTVGNIGLKEGEHGFPDEAIIEGLHKQVDHSAEECYVVVLHNAFNDKAVLDYYNSTANDRFVLSSLRQIERELHTSDFDPQNFECARQYLEQEETVEHAIRSTKEQTFFIGDRGFKLQEGQLASIAGYSAQISRDRMGNISSRGGFARVTSFGHKLNGNPKAEVIATILKATPQLMESLRHGQKFRMPG